MKSKLSFLFYLILLISSTNILRAETGKPEAGEISARSKVFQGQEKESYSQAETDFPSLEPLFICKKSSKEMTGQDIIRYGLLFSECREDSENWKLAMRKYEALENKVKSQAVMSLPPEERGEKILSLMYEDTINQYQENQSRMDTLFLKGTYNCVSSSILYAALARSAQLEVIGVKTPTHAFCTVLIDGKKIDVESTNPYGFDPGKKQLLEKSGNSTKYAVIPKKNYASRQDVAIKTLVSLAGSNLTSSYIKENNYQKALPMGVTVYMFRGGESIWEVQDARDNFDTAALNYSILLGRKNQHLKALEWMKLVGENYGFSKKLSSDYPSLLYNAVSSLLNQGQIDLAEEIYRENQADLSEKDRASFKTMIFVCQTQEKLKDFDKGKDSEGALDYILGLYKTEESSIKEVRQALDKWQEYYWLTLVNESSSKGNYMEAARTCDRALEHLKENANIKNARSNALHNHDVTFHNMVAKYVNSGDYKAALKVLEKGLEENPQSQMLKNDIEKIKRAIK